MALLSSGAVYNTRSILGKTPFEYTCRPSVIAKLLDLVERSFTAVQNGDISVLSELTCQDFDTVKAVVRSRNSEGKTLVVVAILNNFPGLEELNGLLQDDILNFSQTENDECKKPTNEASELFHKAILLRRTELFGSDNPSTLDAREKNPGLLSYKEALSELHDIYQKRLKAVGHNKDTLQTKSKIASLLQSMGEYRESLEVYEATILMLKKLLGSTDILVLSNQMDMVSVLNEMGEKKKALKLNHDILDCIRELKARDHPICVDTQSIYAKVLRNLEKLDEALEIYYEVYETRLQRLGSGDVDTLTTLKSIAKILQEKEKYEHALETSWKILEVQESSKVRNNADELVTKRNIAVMLYALGRYLEAHKLFKDIIIPMVDIFGESHSVTLPVLKIMKKIAVKYDLVYRDGFNILWPRAKTEGDLEKRIIKNADDFQHIDKVDWSAALYHLVRTGDEDGVHFLLINGMDIFKVSKEGVTPLHVAAAYGFEGIVRLFLQHMKQVNPSRFQDFIDAKAFFKGNTALHAAPDARMTRLLLVHGATYDIRNAAGERPLDVAEDPGKANLLRLVEECFNKVEQDYSERTTKLGHLKNDDFAATTRARNSEGYTLHQVTDRAKFRKFAFRAAIPPNVLFSSSSSGGCTTKK